MKIFGLVLMALAVIIFWLCFFRLAPYVAGTIPVGEWQSFFQTVVYIVVGWFGGVGVPLGLFFGGLFATFS